MPRRVSGTVALEALARPPLLTGMRGMVTHHLNDGDE
jgi:hypothetical protein